MKQKDFSEKILVGLTGSQSSHWQSKLEEINRYNIREIALFLECFHKKQREEIYSALLKSTISKIPLVHIRNDMDR